MFVEHAREDQMQLRDATTGDPMLPAVDHVVAIPPISARRHIGGRRSGFGFCDADGRLVAIQHQACSKALLGLAAVLHDGRDRAHVGFHRDAAGDTTDTRHLLDDDRRVEKVAAGAAVLARDRIAKEPRLAHRGDIVPGIGFHPIHLGCTRCDHRLGQAARL